jgi:hypothetical protein
MLIARKSLTSGPQACIFRGKENEKSEGNEREQNSYFNLLAIFDFQQAFF